MTAIEASNQDSFGMALDEQCTLSKGNVQATDLSALGAQAVAQIDRARQAAKEQLQAALDQKPKLLLHVSLDAPKVAIPVPASSTGEGELCEWPRQSGASLSDIMSWSQPEGLRAE